MVAQAAAPTGTQPSGSAGSWRAGAKLSAAWLLEGTPWEMQPLGCGWQDGSAAMQIEGQGWVGPAARAAQRTRRAAQHAQLTALALTSAGGTRHCS